MRAQQTTSEHATTANPTAGGHGGPRPANLLLMTCLGAADGTIVLLAAHGVLSTWTGAIGAGLTVIGGVGAWIAARETFGGRRGRREWALLGVVAAASSLATVAAAWVGSLAGDSLSLLVLPRAVGLVLLLIAVEIGGLRLPRVQGLPLPALALGAAALAEGVAQWTL